MSEYFDKLSNLIKSKGKKKNPNNSAKKEFAAAWSSLAKEEGLSAAAEEFLYDGVVFGSASAFEDYVKSLENPLDAFDKLYSGSLYRKNCISTSSLLLNLLALSINEEGDNAEIIVSLIEQIPGALLNKDGEVYSQSDRLFRKYLFEILNPEVELPKADDLIRYGLTNYYFGLFTDEVDSSIEKLEQVKLSKNCESNIQRFEQWTRSLIDSLHASEDKVHLSQTAIDYSFATNKGSQEEKPEKSAEDPEPLDKNVQENSEQDVKTEKADDIDRLFSELHGVRQKLSALDQLRMQFTRGEEDYKQRINIQDETIRVYENEMVIKNNRIEKLERDKENLRQDIDELNEKIATLQKEVENRDDLIEMFRRDRTKHAYEGINRLASNVKSYNEDYQDAMALEMSLDLGENLRVQFGELLNIVSSFISSNK